MRAKKKKSINTPTPVLKVGADKRENNGGRGGLNIGRKPRNGTPEYTEETCRLKKGKKKKNPHTVKW